MYVDIPKNETLIIEYALLYAELDSGYSAKTTFKSSKYTTNSNVRFSLIQSVGGHTENTIQELTNAELKLAFVGWDIHLKDTIGMRLSDIGFTSYINK